MAKENFVEVLENLLEKKINNDFEFVWDKRNFTITLCFIIDVHNPEHIEVIDIDGEKTTENIAYEDAILFYHPSKSVFDKDDYLAVFPFQDKKGLSGEFLELFTNHLQDVLVNGESDLMDFLTDDTQEVFTLDFLQDEFERKRQSISEAEFYGYPKY
ncbi:MAG: DUF3013 family protein [Streptococcaceae bacterium]|jgi:hypothetical protein|nr:DUF3013 family protein [Streptococcaceae bacterium]